MRFSLSTATAVQYYRWCLLPLFFYVPFPLYRPMRSFLLPFAIWRPFFLFRPSLQSVHTTYRIKSGLVRSWSCPPQPCRLSSPCSSVKLTLPSNIFTFTSSLSFFPFFFHLI
jgi:hypothetical protein